MRPLHHFIRRAKLMETIEEPFELPERDEAVARAIAEHLGKLCRPEAPPSPPS